jgi:hypothetical protein
MNSSKSRVWWRTVPCGVTQAGLAECDLCGKNWRTQRMTVIWDILCGSCLIKLIAHKLWWSVWKVCNFICQAMTANPTLRKDGSVRNASPQMSPLAPFPTLLCGKPFLGGGKVPSGKSLILLKLWSWKVYAVHGFSQRREVCSWENPRPSRCTLTKFLLWNKLRKQPMHPPFLEPCKVHYCVKGSDKACVEKKFFDLSAV